MLTSLLRIGCICHDEPQAAGMTHGVDENATDVLMAKAADALTVALDRADAAEARSTKLLEQYYEILAEQGRCAWNDAIEAAAECVDGNHPIGIIEEILALKKGAKT